MLVPKLNANDESILISEWLVNDNEFIESGQEIVKIETSKVNINLQSEFSGYITRHAQAGDFIFVDNKLASFYPAPVSHIDQPATVVENNKTFQLSKAAEKFIAERNIDLDHFNLSGLVTLKQLEELIAAKNPDNEKSKVFPLLTSENISLTKKLEIKTLEHGYHQAISSSVTVQFNSEEIRNNLKKLPWLNSQILPYILCIFARLLTSYPKLTAFYHANKINYYNQVNLGLAMDLTRELKITVIKNAEQLSLFDMQMNIIDLISKYYENKLLPNDVSGSTVTVTDLSANGILYFQPLLNDKQSVILGVGGDTELSGYPMTLTMVFDHRVLTGREVATFINNFKKEILKCHLNIVEM
jgi:pyruvate/2-oxoglutarate dehydrogenase complex dihydrolipoamide acyltransferase (E2) component